MLRTLAERVLGNFCFLGANLPNSDIRTNGYGYTDGNGDNTWNESGMFLNIITLNGVYGWQIRSNLTGTTLRFRALTDGAWGEWKRISFT